MLSGIGNPTELRRMGINPVVVLPDVGENLQDHPIMTNYFNVSSNRTYDDVLRQPSLLEADLALWERNHTGLFTDSPVAALGFLRLPPNASIFTTERDPAAGSSTLAFLCWSNHMHAPYRPPQRTHGIHICCG